MRLARRSRFRVLASASLAVVAFSTPTSTAVAIAAQRLAPPAAAPADRAPLDLRVNRAVDRACRHVLSQQEPGGGFGTGDKVHPLGRTSLALLALLHGGISITDPKIVTAIDFLIDRLDAASSTRASKEPIPTRSTYETGLTLMLLYDLGPSPRYVSRMLPLAQYLISTFDKSQRMWGYPEGGRDVSNTQYALLGLRAAARRNLRPNDFDTTLHQSLLGILNCQRPDGGVAYQPGQFSRASMTVAALALMRFFEDELDDFHAATKDLARARKAMKGAKAWIDANYSVEDHREGLSRGSSYYYYYIYGLERYGAFCELREIAGHDWYSEGAEFLLAQQNANGSFGTTIDDTCFAILFLRKASLTPPAPGSPFADDSADAPKEPPPRRVPGPDVASLREWLVLGPYSQNADDNALLLDPIGETKVRPAAGKGAKNGKWQRFESGTDEIDLIQAIAPNGGIDFSRTASYAATYVTSDVARDAMLWLSTDDGVRVFLNGKLVHEDHHHDWKADMRVPIALEKGSNLLLLKVENVGYFCRFRARITDSADSSLPGISATTRP